MRVTMSDEYSVRFGRGARTLEYDDPHGQAVFMFDCGSTSAATVSRPLQGASEVDMPRVWMRGLFLLVMLVPLVSSFAAPIVLQMH
jgi:hypothetical protein